MSHKVLKAFLHLVLLGLQLLHLRLFDFLVEEGNQLFEHDVLVELVASVLLVLNDGIVHESHQVLPLLNDGHAAFLNHLDQGVDGSALLEVPQDRDERSLVVDVVL